MAYLRAIEVVNVVLLPMSVVLILWAKELVALLLGSQWAGAVPIFQVLAAGISLRTMVRMMDSLVRGTGRVYACSVVKAINLVLVVLGSLVGSRWGAVGVAVGVSSAILLHFGMMSLLALGIIGNQRSKFIRRLYPGLVAGVAFMVPNLVLRYLSGYLHLGDMLELVCGALFNLLYFWVLWRYLSKLFGTELVWVVRRVLSLLPPGIQNDSGISDIGPTGRPRRPSLAQLCHPDRMRGSSHAGDHVRINVTGFSLIVKRKGQFRSCPYQKSEMKVAMEFSILSWAHLHFMNFTIEIQVHG